MSLKCFLKRHFISTVIFKVLWPWYIRCPDKEFPNTFQTCMNDHKPLKIFSFDFWSIFGRFKNNTNSYESEISLIMLSEQSNIFHCQSVAHLNLVVNPFLILPIIISVLPWRDIFTVFSRALQYIVIKSGKMV